MRRSFRDVLGTLFILLSRMASLAVVMLVLYYFFGIIGMECFSKYDLKNCCKNTTVEANFVYNNDTRTFGYYYLNNFDNIAASYVTLFELTVVNNWFIIMEGYAVTVSQWSRIFFMVFYIVTMVVMTVVVAFILEAFLFRIQYRNKLEGHDIDNDAMMRVEMSLSEAEVRMCGNKNLPFTGYYIKQHTQTIQEEGEEEVIMSEHVTHFRGSKIRGKMDFSLMMYEDELQGWTNEVDGQETLQNDRDLTNPTSSLRLRNNTV